MATNQCNCFFQGKLCWFVFGCMFVYSLILCPHCAIMCAKVLHALTAATYYRYQSAAVSCKTCGAHEKSRWWRKTTCHMATDTECNQMLKHSLAVIVSFPLIINQWILSTMFSDSFPNSYMVITLNETRPPPHCVQHSICQICQYRPLTRWRYTGAANVCLGLKKWS